MTIDRPALGEAWHGTTIGPPSGLRTRVRLHSYTPRGGGARRPMRHTVTVDTATLKPTPRRVTIRPGRGRGGVKSLLVKAGAWDESRHHRRPDGEFASGDGGAEHGFAEMHQQAVQHAMRHMGADTRALAQAQDETRRWHPKMATQLGTPAEASGLLKSMLGRNGHPRADEAYVTRHADPARQTSNAGRGPDGEPMVALHRDRWDYGTLAHEAAHLLHDQETGRHVNGPEPEDGIHGPGFVAHYARLLNRISKDAGGDLAAAYAEHMRGHEQAGVKSLQLKVGPHGYIHNWIYVGIPIAGRKVFHPEFGHGTVHTAVPGRVDVHFRKDATTRSFAVRHDAGRNDFESMTDEQVVHHLGTGQGEAFKYAMTELDRRDRAEREAKTRELYATAPTSKEHADEIYAKLTGLGENPEDAWAHAYGRDTEQMKRDAAIAQLRAQGYKGAGFHELTAKAFKDDAHRRAVAAENMIQGGHLLNPAGRKAGIDPWDLFAGREDIARKYASDELKAHWDNPDHRRETLDEFRERMLGRGRKESTLPKGGDWLQ